MKKLCSFTLFVVLVLLLNACGGGGSDDGSPSAGIEGTGRFISGPIDSYEEGLEGDATITVNGINFTVPNETSLFDTQSDLVEGQVVLVTDLENATENTANQIDIIVNVRGPVSQVSPLINTLTVLGQTIVLSNETQLGAGIELNQLENLPLNTTVQVSGLSTANGQIIATRIDIVDIAPGDELSLLGQISNLNLIDQRFMINNLSVDFTSAAINLENSSTLENGLSVLVTGNLENNIFSASTISGLRLSSVITEGISLDIEALISRFESAQDFDINGISVTTDGSTTYINGEETDLDLNSSLRVTGRINNNGVLVASNIEFVPLNIDILITAPVENIEILQNNAETPDIIGSLQMLGLNMQVTTTTQFEDRLELEERDINLADFGTIQLNDTLDVRGTFDGQNILLTQIIRIPATPTVRLRGLVNTTSNILLIVQGVQVTLSPQSTQFIDSNGQAIDYFDFIAQAPGHSVLTEGIATNHIISADSVQLIASPNGSLLIGTPSSDRLIGTDRDDIILGGADDDQLIGGAGDDVLNGGDGNDFIDGNAGNDELYGGAGFDTLVGSFGQDIIDGGTGGNVVMYGGSPTGVTISLDGSPGQRGYAEGDTLVNIDSLDGTPFDDTLSGSDRGGHLRGFDGNDTLSANIGRVELDGGIGNDTLNGSDDGDHLFGGEGDDELFGNDGGDYLNGGPGADLIDGGDSSTGQDIVDYSNSPSGIRLTIDGATASGGDAQGDTLINIENIIGSNFADEISGDDNNNIIDGRAGDDVLNGGGGSDSIDGNQGNDLLNGGSGNDVFFFYRGGGLDTISQETINNSTDEDRVNFGGDITPHDLWFSANGNDLHIYIIGTANRLTIADWQNNSVTSYLADNQSLQHANIQTLIDVMVIVTPIDGEVLNIPASTLTTVIDTIDATWN